MIEFEERVINYLGIIEERLIELEQLINRNQKQQLEWERKEEAYAPLQFVKFEKLS